ncbi:TIGR02281 family clan AA aspartic protease [Ramlibacter ginsenosidimutans]|uniref:TIGR02281 family clan AA aspartic protease n=1 Tax=Ramlibacter ginsenosidimutans TaxID=502333 RepID=A0A934TWN2_9BURK|nr:TIGR02281 family clan AA aspartic protease [Ramlibacter ginsenosidimutans]MBK6008787.1 TIGR02281 family clan AA aspartic protease [Ramlibacter ginsenosidimutans]
MRRLIALALACAALGAAAQSVTLQGMLGAKALLVVDGGQPKALAPGETFQGVKVLSTSGDQAVLEVGGQRRTVRIGEGPMHWGETLGAKGNRIVLTAGSGGHFITPGAINGRAVQFLVDTGATSVSIGAADAERLGIDYRKGQLARGSTANGIVTVYRIKLDSVRVGDVEVSNVDAAVVPTDTGQVLLGNSFLDRFQMTRFNNQLVLERRY